MKLSIRPRNLDACKYLPIYKCEEIPDLNDYASINRSIPQLPTGMEKEEESEHHLQRAISAQQSKGTTGELGVSIVIPTPEVYAAPENFYNNLYPQNFKLPRQLIHVQPFAFEHDIPDYDRDSEDEAWLESQKDIPNLTPLKFEELIDCFDKNSSQHAIKIDEAKTLIKEDEDLIYAVYDYWLNKRLRLQTPLIPLVKTERRDQSTNNSNNPYIAFRRRTEKMQTRKNRKNDEISYEKMIKLKRDLSRALNLTQLVKQREELKKELVRIRVDIFEKRYLLSDYNGNIINEISAQRQQQIRQQQSNYLPANMKANENKPPRTKDDQQPRKKREYRKRRTEIVQQRTEQDLNEFTFTSDDEDLNDNLSHSVSDQDEDDSDGPYTFKRKKGCQYYAPLQQDPFNWSYETLLEEERSSNKIKYCLTEIRHNNKRQFEYVRRRIGRGGRIILDRTHLRPNFLDEEEEDNTFDYFRPRSSAFHKNQSLEESMDIDEQSNDDNLIYKQKDNSSINDFFNVQTDLYTNYNKNTDADLTKFKNHQKELIEMLKQRNEKLNNKNKNEDKLNNDKILLNKDEEDLNSLNKCNKNNQSLSSSQFINHNSSSITILNLNSVTPNSTIKPIVNSNNSSLNINTTSVPQQKSLSTLDSKSIKFAVSAVLSTVNNSIDSSSSINNSSTIQATKNLNGPLQLNSNNLNDNNLMEYDKLTSNQPSQINNLNSNSITSNQSQFINTQSPILNNNQTTTQLLTQQSQWSNQQQTNELTNSSNVYKLKFQNNQNSLKSEPKLTPTDVT